MTDPDDWAKEDCACGHGRHAHENGGAGRCWHSRMVTVPPSDLPPAIYATGTDEDPFALPTNWPPYETWPQVPAPCCTAFYDAGLAAAEAGP